MQMLTILDFAHFQLQSLQHHVCTGTDLTKMIVSDFVTEVNIHHGAHASLAVQDHKKTLHNRPPISVSSLILPVRTAAEHPVDDREHKIGIDLTSVPAERVHLKNTDHRRLHKER